MPSSRFSGLYLSGRALAVLFIVVGIAGAMAFYRAHTTPEAVWLGLTHSDQQPLATSQVPTMVALNHEQEVLAEHVAPAVVQVNVTAHSGGPAMPGDDSGDQGGDQSPGGGQAGLPPNNPLSQFFGQFGQPRRPQFEQGVGSGILISPDGFIVTNNHVVQDATDIRVTLTDKRTFSAKVVGTDALTDLAVIKIDATHLPNLPWGDSKAIKQGDVVYAFGDPFGLGFTMTHGIISGKGRLAVNRTDLRAPGDYLQTDAAINPGNSGGPLVDVRGEVVGVNAFIYTSTGSFSGEAFAIPSEIVKPITAALIAKGKVVRGYLGISIVDITPEEAHFFGLPATATGALVSQITAGAAGEKAGLRAGDLITSFNGAPIASPTELQLATASVPPGSTVKLGVLRDGKPLTLTPVLGIAPQDEAQSASASPAAATPHGVRLGVRLTDLTPELRDRFQYPDTVRGAVITSVIPGGPAYNAQLVPGVVISEVNRVKVANTEEVNAQLRKLPPDQDVLLRIFTGGPQGGAFFIVVHPAAAGGGGR
ncbi:MAG TPA: trypsin-like peptidase domain-containing protein [Terriglobales bacterium]|nr:trypsin-like peptidase domain-containing protein [Terriglobales bacterium]